MRKLTTKLEADPGRLDQMVHPMAERSGHPPVFTLLSYIKDACYVDGNQPAVATAGMHCAGHTDRKSR